MHCYYLTGGMLRPRPYPRCRWCGLHDHAADVHLSCKYCGACDLESPCHNVHCYSGRVVVSGSPVLAYQEKSEFINQNTKELLEHTRFSEITISLVLEYVCPITRYYPCDIPRFFMGLYLPLMRAAFYKSGPVEFAEEYDAVWRNVLYAVFVDESPSFFDRMCALHIEQLQQQFHSRADAEKAAIAVWNNECDDRGISVYSICIREWDNFTRMLGVGSVVDEYDEDYQDDDDDDDIDPILHLGGDVYGGQHYFMARLANQ